MFARYLVGACAILFSVLVNVPASAWDRPQDYHRALQAACGKEFNSHCKGVPDARGQLLACLYKQQANLSPWCEGTVWGTMARLGKALEKVETVLRYCGANAQQFCKETVPGGGNLISCFLVAQQMMSPQCKAAVYSIWDRKPQRG